MFQNIDKFDTGLLPRPTATTVPRQVQPTVSDTQIEVIILRSKRGNKILYDCFEMGAFRKS